MRAMLRGTACRWIAAAVVLASSTLAQAQPASTADEWTTRSGSAPVSLPSTPTAPAITAAPNGQSTVSRASTLNGTTTLIAPGAGKEAAATNGHMPNGAKAAEINGHRTLTDSLGGLVVNQVMTLAGQDFYAYFANAWRDMPLSDRYIVSIRERPSARWGSLIWVEFDNRRVFEQFLPPKRADLKPIAERAAAVAYNGVVQADIAKLLFHDVDLGADEM